MTVENTESGRAVAAVAVASLCTPRVPAHLSLKSLVCALGPCAVWLVQKLRAIGAPPKGTVSWRHDFTEPWTFHSSAFL